MNILHEQKKTPIDVAMINNKRVNTLSTPTIKRKIQKDFVLLSISLNLKKFYPTGLAFSTAANTFVIVNNEIAERLQLQN